MAVTSDASPFTSLTASPMESHDVDELPIELKIPLPSSSAGSEDNGEEVYTVQEPVQESLEAQTTGEKDVNPNDGDPDMESRNVTIPDISAPEDTSKAAITLKELAHLVELEACQKRRAISVQEDLDRLRHSCGLDKRMISTFDIAYGNMIDQYKTDDQAGFAGIFDACEQLEASCNPSDRSNEFSSMELEKKPVPGNDMGRQCSIQMLPHEEQEVILAFLAQIRNQPEYLSDRLSNMTPTELTALTATYHPAGIDLSILPNHSHGKSLLYSRDSQMMKLSRRMDNLHRFHNQDPFFALLYSVFDPFAFPGSQEYIQRQNIWSTVCARNMVEGFVGSRPGSDEFAIASLDAFSGFQDWTLKPMVETYLMRLLVEGSFLLETVPNPAIIFQEPMETQYAKRAIAEADFFENALTDLFELLTAGDIQQAVPEDLLVFAHAVLRKIEDPKLRLRAQQFIVIRWYFATFISSVVVYPEVRGLLLTQHVGESARQLIWQKLIIRMQQRVFDVILPSNNHALVKPEIRDGVMAIYDTFEPSFLEKSEDLPKALGEADEASCRYLMLNSQDLIGLIQALCPDRTLSSSDLVSAGPISDRPSTAGSSTLVAASCDVPSGMDPTSTADSQGHYDPVGASVTGSPAKEEDSRDRTKGEMRNASAKHSKMLEENIDDQLRRTCQKLKDDVARYGTSNSGSPPNSWTFVYYSEDGLELFMGPKQLREGFPAGTSHVKHSNMEDRTDTVSSLKAALIVLLSEHEASEQSRGKTSVMSGAVRSRNPRDPLETLMDMAQKTAESTLNFGEAHSWWSNLNVYRTYLVSNPSNSYHTLLQDISTSLRTSIDAAANLAMDCEKQCRSLDTLHNHTRSLLAGMKELRNGLRMKMWYVSDVRHSATYEEALYVTRALRTMGSLKKHKQTGSIQHWARQRLRGSNIRDRAEAQTLEAMAAPKDHGGLPKLADEQVELTSRWLTRKSIENFCKGEERIHRFCYEVQKSAGKIAGTNLLESPVLWSSNLYKRERYSFDAQRFKTGPLGSPFSVPFAPAVQYEQGHLPSPTLSHPEMSSKPFAGHKSRSPSSSFGALWSGTQPLPGFTGLGLYGSQSTFPPTPTSPPTSWSSNSFSSPSHPHTSGPPHPFNSPATATHSRGNSEGESSPAKRAFAEQIEKTLISLLISDLGYLLWNEGSETDVWINSHFAEEQSTIDSSNAPGSKAPLGNTEISSYDISQRDWAGGKGAFTSSEVPEIMDLRSPKRTAQDDEPGQFPFFKAYRMLLKKMSLTHDPYAKLHLFYELEELILKSMDSLSRPRSAGLENTFLRPGQGNVSLRSKSVPRTKTTSLEEVIANCTERRAGTLRSKKANQAPSIFAIVSDSGESNIPGTDDAVNAFLSIFQDPKLRPTTLFRDLQYIAAFVPPETLDRTARGKAFWDAGLAALALKEDLCESITRRASNITAYHISPRNSLDPAADQALASTTLRDAARLWLITAKEGSPVAARELGLFYLTHPELLPRITMPLAKAKDVYKSTASNDLRGGGDKEKGALDPYTFAVVFHWMEVAANGGDKDARDFLKGNGELSSGR